MVAPAVSPRFPRRGLCSQALVDHAKLAALELQSTSDLTPFFEPRVVAVIGASRERNKIGTEILHNLLATNFAGSIVPVHPAASEIFGLKTYPAGHRTFPARSTWRSIVVPAAQVEAVVDDCVAKGVKAICIISAGFGECGEEGRVIEQRIVAKARAAGCRIIGPNCMGLLNTDPQVLLNATFSPIYPPRRQRRDVDAKRRARPGDSRLREEAQHRHLDFRVGRQQGRRLGQRSAELLGEPIRARR